MRIVQLILKVKPMVRSPLLKRYLPGGIGNGSERVTASFIDAQKPGVPVQEDTFTDPAINPLPETVNSTLPLLPELSLGLCQCLLICFTTFPPH